MRCRSPASRPTPFLWKTSSIPGPTPILRKTPEVTTVRAAIRTTAVGQSKMGYLTHRVRHCRNLQQLPQVRCQPPGSGSTHTLKKKQGSPVSGTTPFLWKTSKIPGPTPFLWETPEVTTAAKGSQRCSLNGMPSRCRQQLQHVLRSIFNVQQGRRAGAFFVAQLNVAHDFLELGQGMRHPPFAPQ